MRPFLLKSALPYMVCLSNYEHHAHAEPVEALQTKDKQSI